MIITRNNHLTPDVLRDSALSSPAFFRVAAVQMASGPNVSGNLQEAGRLIELAAASGARIVALPEYFAIMGMEDTDKVAVREKPDILWDRPDLERLYARLEDEYELVERAETLGRKLDLIGDTVTVMTDLIDTERSLRLEAIIVGLIVLEVAITLYQMATGTTH